MSMLKTLGRMLGVADHQAEDAMHSERAARAVLTRRNFFAAGAAMAAGTVMVPGSHIYVNPWDTGTANIMDVMRFALKFVHAAKDNTMAHEWIPIETESAFDVEV